MRYEDFILCECNKCYEVKPSIAFPKDGKTLKPMLTCLLCYVPPKSKTDYYKRSAKMKYHTKKLQRTPKWLNSVDFVKIDMIYKNAQHLTKTTGILHEVDHIIPLQGKLISGLHVPWNLQVLTRTDNRRKHNK